MRYATQVTLRPRDYSFYQGGGVAPVIVYRTQNYRTYGSSTYDNANNTDVTNLRGNATPALLRGTIWQVRVENVVPTQNASTITRVSVPQTAGNNNQTNYDIMLKLQADILSTVINVNTPIMFGGVNLIGPAATNPPSPSFVDNTYTGVDWLRQGQESLDAVGCKTFLMWIFPNFSSNNQIRYSQWLRLQKLYKSRQHPLRGIGSFEEAQFRATIQNVVQDDINAVAARYRPITLASSQVAHSTGEGYYNFGDYAALAVQAWEGGLPFFPSFDYASNLSAPGKIADLYFSGYVTGCTITVDNPAYSITTAPNPNYPATSQVETLVELNLVGALPAVAPVTLNVTVARPGYGSQTYRITHNNMRRNPSDNTPQKTIIRQAVVQNHGVNDDPLNSYFPVTSRKFSMVVILKMLPLDGARIMFQENAPGTSTSPGPTGTSDGTSFIYMQWAAVGNRVIMQLRRNAVNGWEVQIYDTAGVFAINVTTPSNGLREQEGTRALFVSYDADQPAKCAAYMSAKTGGPGGNYALTTTAITPGGNGTLGLNHGNGTLTHQFLFFSSAGVYPATPFMCEHSRTTIYDTGFIDFSIQANRDAFFDTATQTALPLPGDGSSFTDSSTGLPISPIVDFRGDAAECMAGYAGTSWTNVANGGKMYKNFGTGDGFMSSAIRPFEFV